MCGIFLVKSKDNIPLEKHLEAFKILSSRGPDLSRYRYENNVFIGQTVLHITGTSEYYQQDHTNFLAYNGEIYNANDFGNYNNDIEFVHATIENSITDFKKVCGTWAWIYSSQNTILYASDPQGEKPLYRYVDNDILIVCSEISPILQYIKNIKVDVPYNNKCWTIEEQTPWQGITKLIPGVLYNGTDTHSVIDSIFDWHTPTTYKDFGEAYSDFKSIWSNVIASMKPACSSGLSYSGGLDSNLILNSIPDMNLYTVDIVGKDPIVNNILKFLTPNEISRLHVTQVNTTQWAVEFKEMAARTKLPTQTWSHVGKWIISKQCNDRVLFTGVGADELFGGYDLYKHISYTPRMSSSPYSEYGDVKIWNKCMTVYDDPRQATLLMDYLYQVVGCDAIGIDSIAGAWGIEIRNPFLTKPMIQFAMNLPFEYKVGATPKPLIRQLFLERWDAELIYPKMGFAGHANDSFPEYPVSGNRYADWKHIAKKEFYEK